MYFVFFLLQGSVFLLIGVKPLKKKIHTVQSVSFVDFKREALFSSEMWRQLENKGKEQKLAIICSVGWEKRKKTMQIEGRKLVPPIFLYWGPILSMSLQWCSPLAHPTLPSF